MDKLICYCFNFTESDIVKDIEKNCVRSLILEKIVAVKRQGNCRCETEHPERR